MTNNGDSPFEIQYQECEGHLYAFISGKSDSVAAALEYWQLVIDECRRRGFHALLVEEDFPNQLSTIEMFTVTSAIPKMGSKGLKIAFVDKEAEHYDLNLFGETVAVNRGVHGRVFATRQEAVAWLSA